MRAELEFWIEVGFVDFLGAVVLLAVGIPFVAWCAS